MPYAAPLYASLVATLSADLKELNKRRGVGKESAVHARNHAFKPRWLTDRRARFELVGLVNRTDRKRLDPTGAGCGEARLIYRLAMHPPGRPITRLPMTLNLMFPQPAGADGTCADVAQAWLALPDHGTARLDALAARLHATRGLAEVEVDLQNLHGVSFAEGDDDHAEYLLRGFAVDASGPVPQLVPKKLVDTLRPDLDADERARLRAWVVEHFQAIDEGRAVLPDEFLATRAVSVTPRGLARPENRVFTSLFGDDPKATAAFARLPYAGAKVVRSPAALFRRIEQASCPGCHQTRAIAGFHLLGEERDRATFNRLAVGASPHMNAELAWRRGALEKVAAHAPDPPEPLADHGAKNGGYGAP
jgi:hypothetical protein